MNRKAFFARNAAAIILFFSNQAHSQEIVQENACGDAKYRFVYFNGIRTSRDEAEAQLKVIKLLSQSWGYKGNFSLAYNTSTYTKGSLTELGWSDALEVFEQRMREEPAYISNRYELFLEAQSGGGPLSTLINSVNPGFSQFIFSMSDEIRGNLVEAIASIRNKNLSISDYSSHQSLLDEALNRGQKLLLFSHSQGALFSNQANIYIQQRASVDRVRAVYVAPASSQVFGAYTLADNDLVINALRVLGPVQDWNVKIPGYDARPPGIAMGYGNGRDYLGHGLMEIYLNSKLSTYKNVNDNIIRAFDDLSITPPSMNLFDISMTWTGGGEVNIRVDEPNHPAGTPGQIGITSNKINGPDTYQIPCTSSESLAGRYMFTYQAAVPKSGRFAKLTVTSGGKLLSDAVFALAPNTSSVTIASIRVKETGEPGVYTVSMY